MPGSKCPSCLISCLPQLFAGLKDITCSYPKCQMHVTVGIYLVEFNPSYSISAEAVTLLAHASVKSI